MIDWEKTKKETEINKEYFDKFPKSGKKIFAICDNCEKIRLIPYQSYRELCHVCACSTEKFKNTKSISQQGENNSNYKGGKVKLFCDYCGEKIERYPSGVLNLNFCCRECHDKYRVGENATGWRGGKITVTCEQCGTEYECLPSIIERSRFCSKECQYEWMSENFKGENGPGWKGGKIKLICEQCGDEFECFPSQASKFCSMKCYYESFPPKRIVICEQCGHEFTCKSSQTHIRFCSEECYGLHRVKTYSGENHYNYGKKLSEETCQRKSASMQGIPYEDWDGFSITEDWRDWSKAIYLNEWFPGCHRHHITETLVICVPAELHNRVYHNLKTGRGMAEINMLALQYINECYN